MSPQRQTAIVADTLYVAEFPGGRVELRLNRVPLHLLPDEDRAFVDDLIQRVTALGTDPA